MQLKIVYIDDEPELLEMFVDNFESDQVAVITFSDPNKGVEEVVANGSDLVFLDYRLPNTNGFEVAKLIPKDVPIALISGDLLLKDNDRFLRIFSKPFDFGDMENFILEFVARKESCAKPA